jgi:uncharacterized cupin superfamily protein
MPDWFVRNVGEVTAKRHPIGAVSVSFEEGGRFPELGFNIRVLEPGQPASLYHAETVQEDFLVLSGEVLAILDGEERQLRAWDFVHCPPGTAHVFVGAGDGPSSILMVGARREDRGIHYPVNEAAARFGASVERETTDPKEAYAPWGRDRVPVELDWPPA